MTQYQIGLLIYPDVTQLDVTASLQVFSMLPNTNVHLLWKTSELIKDMGGFTICPTTTFDTCPQLDVICVPGGGMGQVKMMRDTQVLKFIQAQAQTAKYVTSVCTGSLILAAAGLLQGYKAACHWAFRENLALMGVEVSTERVVIDRNRITGGGVTAGIDFALVVAAELYGENTAKFIQLLLEYNPAPPFNAGSPESAGEELVAMVKKSGSELIAVFLEASKEAAHIQQISC
ncbi:ThiJ family protein [Rivularia sp. IAM M-261]|nr:ThiJ family protein [Calothrix sp. PCC 7716]GJD16772.1 ThiJ family protein [Rivularia sp. IAM M-261]